MSTHFLIPGMRPQAPSCQNVHPRPAQLCAGTRGDSRRVQLASHSGYPARANRWLFRISVLQRVEPV
jgi:hypothetical protein